MFKIDRFDGRKSSLATKLKIIILWMPIVFSNVKIVWTCNMSLRSKKVALVLWTVELPYLNKYCLHLKKKKRNGFWIAWTSSLWENSLGKLVSEAPSKEIDSSHQVYSYLKICIRLISSHQVYSISRSAPQTSEVCLLQLLTFSPCLSIKV